MLPFFVHWVEILRHRANFEVGYNKVSSLIRGATDCGVGRSKQLAMKWDRIKVLRSAVRELLWEARKKGSANPDAMNSMKRQNDKILKEELPRLVGAQYATGDQWRNNSRKNEGLEPKQKQYPAVDVTGDRSKVRCCKEQHCISQLEGYEKIASLFSLRARNLDVGSSRDFQKSHSVSSAFILLGYPWLQGEVIDKRFFSWDTTSLYRIVVLN